MADGQTVLKLIRLFRNRKTFTKLEFYYSLIWTENALKLTYVQNFKNFPRLISRTPFYRGKRLREGEGWGGEGNMQSKMP
jgi:hypothetical protein